MPIETEGPQSIHLLWPEARASVYGTTYGSERPTSYLTDRQLSRMHARHRGGQKLSHEGPNNKARDTGVTFTASLASSLRLTFRDPSRSTASFFDDCDEERATRERGRQPFLQCFPATWAPRQQSHPGLFASAFLAPTDLADRSCLDRFLASPVRGRLRSERNQQTQARQSRYLCARLSHRSRFSRSF